MITSELDVGIDRYKEGKTMKIMTLRLSILFIISIFFILPQGLFALSPSETELISGAKKEGQFLLYCSMQVDQSTPILKKFEEKYPFIKTGLYRPSGKKIMNKYFMEERANKFSADCILISGFHLIQLQKRNLLKRYVSPESEEYPDYFKDPKGYWNASHANTYVIGYNTKLISSKEVPKTYEDLLDPKWKGKIGFDNEDYEWMGNILKMMGREKGISYLRKLSQQNLQIRHGHTLITQLIIAGEFPLGFVFGYAAELVKAKGAPIDWVGLEPVVTGINVIVIPDKAPHPYSAKLFVDFILSNEGQVLLRDLTSKIPARSDVEPIPARLTKGLKLFVSSPSLAEEANELAILGREIFPVS